MSDLLSRLLAERAWLLLDGATGTNLFAMGLQSGDAPELWNLEAPDNIRALHRGFIEAGSDLILTNSFGANALRLRLHGAEGRVAEINRAAAAIARECADAAGRPVVVAGSVGPTGEILEPVGTLSMADAVAAFEEQMAALIKGGADVIWTETMSSAEEFRAAAEAAARLGVPFCSTLSFDTAGRTMMGLTAADYAALAFSLAHPPLAIGANCGTGPADLMRTLLELRAAAPDAALIAKANAGIPSWVEGRIHYDGTPELMAEFAVLARDAGARLIGGCCGTTAAHIGAMRAALETRPSGPAPDLETVRARLGDFTATAAEAESAGGAARRGRRGRRRG